MAQREHFAFGGGQLIHTASIVGVTDGTVNPQVIGGSATFLSPTAPGNMLVEPFERSVFGNMGTLDDLTRALIFAGRSGGTGTWTFDIQMQRGTEPIEVPAGFNDIALNGTSTTGYDPIVVDPFAGPSLLTASAGNFDGLKMLFSVTPGQALAAQVFLYVCLVPSGRAAGSGRGNVTSGNAYKVV